MPVITPAYPSMCSTHNISQFTKKIICREMERAAKIVEKIFSKQLQWKDLFAKHSFFTNGYKYYLSVIAASRSREAQLIWSGLVESKVRLLVASLEHVESVELAHPFIKGFDRVHRCHTEDEVEKILSGDLQFHTKDIQTESTDLVADQKREENGDGGNKDEVAHGEAHNGNGEEKKNGFEHTIYTTTFYIGIEIIQGGLLIALFDCSADVFDRWHQAIGSLVQHERVQGHLHRMAAVRSGAELPDGVLDTQVSDPLPIRCRPFSLTLVVTIFRTTSLNPTRPSRFAPRPRRSRRPMGRRSKGSSLRWARRYVV